MIVCGCRLFTFMGIKVISAATFFNHQKLYLHKAIKNVWSRKQEEVVAALRSHGKSLILAGDARCDYGVQVYIL